MYNLGKLITELPVAIMYICSSVRPLLNIIPKSLIEETNLIGTMFTAIL